MEIEMNVARFGDSVGTLHVRGQSDVAPPECADAQMLELRIGVWKTAFNDMDLAKLGIQWGFQLTFNLVV